MSPETFLAVLLLTTYGAGAVVYAVGMGVAMTRARRPVRGLDALGPPPLTFWRAWFWRAGAACPWAVGPLGGLFIFGIGLAMVGAMRGWVGAGGLASVTTPAICVLHSAVILLWLAAAWMTRLVTRLRWPVAALGEPALTAGPQSPDVRQFVSFLAPPVLTPAGTERRGGREFVLAAVMSVGVPAVWLAVPPWRGGPPPELRLTFLAVAFGGAWLFLVAAVAAWWGLPRARGRWVTAEGFAAGTMAVRWNDAARVALAPVPAGSPAWTPPGSVAVEVSDGERCERFLAGPDVRAELDRLLAAVPPGRLVRVVQGEP